MTPNSTREMQDRWEHNAYMGLTTSDKWTFAYSEKMNWWDVPVEFQPYALNRSITGIYPGVAEGIINARTKYFAGKALGWDWFGTNVYGNGTKDTSVTVKITNLNPITVDAISSNGAISRVDFFRNMVLIGSDTSAPYTLNQSDIPTGSYTLVARAFDSRGMHGTSNLIHTAEYRHGIMTRPENGRCFDKIPPGEESQDILIFPGTNLCLH